MERYQQIRGSRPSSPAGQLRWTPAKNNGSGTIPRYGLVRTTGVDTDGDTILVDKPNADSQDVMIWTFLPGAAGARGAVTNSLPFYAAYDPADGTPAAGETWGAGNGTYLLKKNKTGFTIVGNADGTIVMVKSVSGVALAVNTTNNGTGDSTVSVSGVTTIQIDQASGLVETNPSSGTVKIAAQDVSATHKGVVNLSNQKLGVGDKYVDRLGVNVSSIPSGGVMGAVTPKEYITGSLWLNSGGVYVSYGSAPTATIGFAGSVATLTALDSVSAPTANAILEVDYSLRRVNATSTLGVPMKYACRGINGLDTTINYRKAGGASDGTITVVGGIITAVT